MFSYNNIIQKEEPVNKALIDTALADAHLDRPSRVEKIGDALECMVVHDFLPDEECEALMQACEQVGYTYWRQASADPKAVRSEEETSSTAVREVDTIEANFPTLSKALFNRIQHCIDLPTKSFSSTMENADEVFESDLEGDWVPYALSENLLFGRYGAGGHFMPHIDGSTIVDINTRSMYTLLIYLNSCPQGGETFIFKGEQSEILYFDEAQKSIGGRHPIGSGRSSQ
ncbi:hypothetical protein AGDE_08767 [Angomonas deanei]|nr:hypothetical protein AGDE_09977 [Angomonas deanei]EPY32289.1 hypothetical protein AGDE_08767 [Angomonas deanei]|eukprot:EPY29395.1 hypothetical protein AGDE_09977 [Angomonas deanei]